ncbi:MAG: LamG domain-containing protein [Planctomycetes bacterium]|nr:LamG domain-containing protein [Planctomycetota bacterium]
MSLRATLVAALFTAFAAAPLEARQVQSLVAHWDFSETSGPTLHDLSANGYDATTQGGVVLGQPGASASSGNAALFSAAGNCFATFAGYAPLSDLRSDLSVAAWVRADSGWAGPTPRRIFGGQSAGWSCGINPNGLRFTTVGVLDYDLPLPSSYPIGQWFHVAFVFDAAFDVTYYIDGVAVGQVTGSQQANVNAGNWLLGSWSGNIEFWDGALDDVQVYQGTLTPADVAFLHANPGATVAPGGGAYYCAGDGSVTPCPCGNNGAAGEGCANSTGQGARVALIGTVSVTGDDLVFAATQLVPAQPAVLFAAHNALPAPYLGDGLRCAGGGAVRLGLRMTDASGAASWGPGLAATAGWQAGDTRRFQVWYADGLASPCGGGANLSAAVELVFTL